jgi:hypothetical protein
MPARLIVIAGPDQGKAFVLPAAGPLLIGRGRDAAARLNDPHASRSHCQVKVEGGRIVVEDLDSNSGLFVNDHRVRTQALKPGDVLRLGTTLLRLESDDLADQTTLAPPPAAVPARAAAAAKPPPPPPLPPPIAAAAKPLPPPPPPGSVAKQPPLYDLSGQMVAHFRVGPVIAPGKTGVVFRARDTRENVDVALKVFLPEFSYDEEERQRFVRAMKTIMPLRHAHLVSIHNAGRSGRLCWVAMELVEGVSLAPAVQHAASSGGGEWRVAYRAVLHVARALAYLHGQHIIHRNITPSNILLQTTDGIIKLGDLMTVKAQEGRMAKQVTQAGELLGDLRFLSPEQTTSASGGDGRADLYSLGATAYALIAGRPPLEGRSQVETILQIRQAEPVPLRQLRPGTPPAFEATIMKLLAKKPEDRIASAGQLLGHLANLGIAIS